MDRGRRTTLAGLATLGLTGQAASAGAAPAYPPAGVTKNPAFKLWDHVKSPHAAPLDLPVTTTDGRAEPLRAWLDARPTVLVIWATWCPPCMAEKPFQGALQSRLIASGSRTRIKSLQAYDDKTLAEGRATVDRLGGASLDLARASPPMEKAFQDVFGKSPVDPTRITLPSLLLLDANGRELGRLQGSLTLENGQSYWAHPVTVDFLSSLDKLLA